MKPVAAVPFSNIHQPRLSGVNADRTAHLCIIREALSKPKINSATLNMALDRASDNQIASLAAAIKHDPERFKSIMIREGGASARFHHAPTLAVIYDKSVFSENNDPEYRRIILKAALLRADKHINGGDSSKTESNWNLEDEDEATRARVKRFTTLWIVSYLGTKQSRHDGLMERTLDDSRSDHDAVLAIVRDRPSISEVEVNFILNTGDAALADGAL
jgi:hypothetical protein